MYLERCGIELSDGEGEPGTLEDQILHEQKTAQS